MFTFYISTTYHRLAHNLQIQMLFPYRYKTDEDEVKLDIFRHEVVCSVSSKPGRLQLDDLACQLLDPCDNTVSEFLTSVGQTILSNMVQITNRNTSPFVAVSHTVN